MSIIRQVCRSPSCVAWANDSYRFIFPAAALLQEDRRASARRPAPAPGRGRPTIYFVLSLLPKGSVTYGHQDTLFCLPTLPERCQQSPAHEEEAANG